MTTKNTSPSLVTNAKRVRIKEQKEFQKIEKNTEEQQEVLKEKPPEEQIVKEQEAQPEQEFSKEAPTIQDQVIGQQLQQQTEAAEAPYQDQIAISAIVYWSPHINWLLARCLSNTSS